MTYKSNPSLGGEAVRLTISKVITLCISMATSMLLARFRSFEEYGTYSQLLLVINLFISLLMLGLPSSINFFLARSETQEEKTRFISVFYSISTILSLLIGVLLVLSIPLIESYFHNPNIRHFSYFLAVFPWASIVTSSIENVLIVFKKVRFLLVFRVLYSISVLCTVISIQVLGFGFKTYMAVFIGVNALFSISVYIIASHLSGRMYICFDKNLIKTILIFSVPIGLSSVVGTINTEFDKLLIGYLLNTEQLAIYTNAAKELPLVIIPSSITAILLPQISKMIKDNRTEEAIRLWGNASELAMIVISIIVAGIITYSKEVMTILYSSKYLPGESVFRIYTLNLLLRCTYFGIILNACGETKKIFYCSLISLGLNLILNPLFYWIFGIIGPAIATFLAILIVLLMQLKMTAKVSGIRFSKVFPWKNITIILLINTVLAVLFGTIKTILPLEQYCGEIVESVILGCIWCFLYTLLMRKRIIEKWHVINHEG